MPSAAKQAGATVASSRPPALFALFAPAMALPGAGPASAAPLRRLLGRDDVRCLDLLRLAPRAHIDTSPLADLAAATDGQPVTLELEIVAHRDPGDARRPFVTIGRMHGGEVDLCFFGPTKRRLAERLVPGQRYLLHGRLGRFRDRWQMPHPQALPQAPGGRLAVYPAVDGLPQGRLRKLVGAAIERLPEMAEWLEPALLQRHGWPGHAAALLRLHGLESEGGSEPARRRLAFDELLALQIGLALARRHRTALPGRATIGDGALRRRFLATLPFSPTLDQERAAAEIESEIAAPPPMTRLLQGDVGSGKTVVAFLAMLQAVEAGRQAALMAPTEILARQHHRTLAAWAEPLGLEVALLVGGDRAESRERAREALATGAAALAVGTHALFQEGTAFADLALAVVDEQHRFGVEQRLALAGKGYATDLLLMTATPIPRTLVLGLYGDLPVSALRAKPAGRQPIVTRVMPARRQDEVVEACARALAEDARIYWICPSIEASDDGRKAAEERHGELEERFGDTVALAHGRLKPSRRELAMRAFAEGSARILVATTVVEVGVDVPEATVIVIENAERFGLAQLHQLRGRVGRGTRRSACLLLYGPDSSATALERLAVLRGSDDGFEIAEADMRLRGPGEVLGVRQSGLPRLHFADWVADGDLLGHARDEAARLLDADPELASERGASLRLLLHLFEREEALASASPG
ncbi:ATP-dependent DNA helicase RecG [Geminicoccaceae bacterium 1502E]|nr:ATP-dependent DNA helicase RecG [Geminicoccaceae bacterium 1502E]